MDMSHDAPRNWKWLRWAGWCGAVALVAAPLVLMKVAPETGFDWTAGDFVLAAVLIGSVGLLAELAVRASSNWPYRLGAAMAIGTGFLLIWSNLAVGYIGDGDAPINGMFLVLPILALLAAIVARGRAQALAWIMAATGAAHAVTGIIGFPQDTRTGPITILFVALWLASAALFRNATKDRA
jgi:hypothetical protein